MKTLLATLATTVVFLLARADDGTNGLWSFAAELQKTAQHEPPPVALTASLKTVEGKHFLAFRLTNTSGKPLRLYPHQLPWGSPHSLELAAVTTDGTPFRYGLAESNPLTEERIVLPPGAAREGDYRLSWALEYPAAPREKDVVVVWAYRVPVERDGPRPVCTGVVVIPKKQ
jgi:hypothetical protein